MHYCYISSPRLAELLINIHHIYPHTHSIIVEVIISGGKHHLMLHTSLLDTILLCFVLHTYTHAIKTHHSPFCNANMPSKPTLLHFVLHIYTHAIKTHPSQFCTANMPSKPIFSVLYCTHAIKTHLLSFILHTCRQNPSFSILYCTHTRHQNPSFSNVYCTHTIKTHPSPFCTEHTPSKPILFHFVLHTYTHAIKTHPSPFCTVRIPLKPTLS